MYESVKQTDNNIYIYIFFGFIAVIVFIITAYYIKSCYDCKSEDNCCQRGDLKIFCSADCTLETDSPPPEVDCVGDDCALETDPPPPEVDCVGDDCTLETDPPPPEVDCVGQWGEWGECSVGCTDDGSGSGIQSRSYSIMVNSENNGNECPENEGTTMTRVCNDGLLCHNDCEGSWEITNCQNAEGIDVICGPSERTYTFTKTIHPINDGETCLERYGSEIPEYIRNQLPTGDLLNVTTVTEQCHNSSASDLPFSYISRSCGYCDLTENNRLDNNACVPKICGELPSGVCHKDTQHRRLFNEIGFDAATCCVDKTCGEWESGGNTCDTDDRKFDSTKEDVVGYSDSECCVYKTCGEWDSIAPLGNRCNAGTTLKSETVNGFTQGDCCRPLTCGEWFDDEGDCNEMTTTRKGTEEVGHTLEQCCEPKTCREIKQTLGEDTCPGNINTRIYNRDQHGGSLGGIDKGLNLCFKNLDETIPVNKIEGNQWEEICCGPSKIESKSVAEVRYDDGLHSWTIPAYNNYQFKAGRCDPNARWTKANSNDINIINDCHNRQALDLPNVETECPSDNDAVQQEIYDSVYVDTFIKSESGWRYCTEPRANYCRNDTPDYSLLNY